MVVTFDKPKANSKGVLNSAGSSAGFVQYMEKEKELLQTKGQEVENWFNLNRDECHPAEVRASIDSDHQGIRKEEKKFATGSINPTENEWKALGNTEKERLENFKSWVQRDFTQEFADNYTKKDSKGNPIKIEPENVKIYYKVEFDRYYTGKDEKVKNGLKKQGEPKEGFNIHCHFIVATKTVDGKNRISPTTKRSEFDRDKLTHRAEKSFDIRTGYDRPIKDTYEYAKTMKNGTAVEKIEMVQKVSHHELFFGGGYRPEPMLNVDKKVHQENIDRWQKMTREAYEKELKKQRISRGLSR